MLLFFGDPGPAGPVPSGAFVDPALLIHRVTAVFEFKESAVFIRADDRDFSESGLVALVERWMVTAH